MCLIDTWGALRGVPVASRVLTGWLSMCLSPIPGWLSNEVPAGWCPRLWRGSKEARAQFPESGLPAAVSVSKRKGKCYECDDWY